MPSKSSVSRKNEALAGEDGVTVLVLNWEMDATGVLGDSGACMSRAGRSLTTLVRLLGVESGGWCRSSGAGFGWIKYSWVARRILDFG